MEETEEEAEEEDAYEERLREDLFTDCTQASGLGDEEFESMNAEMIDAAETENAIQHFFIQEDMCQDSSTCTDLSGLPCESSYFEKATS